ncbi:MFS transporter [Ramlibacter algicola]|uniref:MFS transporter n=1 Tax=Ramlibacter algicola TaxID=2795217 RepID=A0A934Q4S5_9BURK|nr:MFS transporter [Ramlibacter algicola]
MPLPVLALALAAFAVGTTEFVIMGLLPAVATDLGVGLPDAGLLVTGYALGVAFGAPPVAALAARVQPHRSLAALMLVFIAGNLVCAVAPDYRTLMAGRIIASLTHGAFFGVGSAVAAGLVAADRRAAAIALMFSGLTLANVLGVPAGAWIGAHAGWRVTFWIVCALGLVALVGVWALVPRHVATAAPGASAGWGILARPRFLAALLLTATGFGGMFAALTYVAPLLHDIAGFSTARVNATLVVFGLGTTVGNVVGGWLSDRWPVRSMFAILLALAVVEATLSLAALLPAAVAAASFLWGLAAFATAPGLQARVLDEAPDAPALASTLNIGAFNLGNAGGAWLGGRALAADVPLVQLPLLAAALALVAVAVLAWITLDTRIARHRTTTP